eukprot:jgi/Bigna1/128590/aug1.7_g3298
MMEGDGSCTESQISSHSSSNSSSNSSQKRSFIAERLRRIKLTQRIQSSAREKATRMVSSVVLDSLGSSSSSPVVVVEHGSRTIGTDISSSDLDLLICPPPGLTCFMKNRHILQDWADAKKILSVYEKSNEDIAPSVRCTICQVSVSRNRILQRADVPVCANCWELGDEVVMIIQEYSVSLSMRRWAALAFNKPLRLVEAGLQMHPQVSCVEYIEFTRVPIVRCKIQIDLRGGYEPFNNQATSILGQTLNVDIGYCVFRGIFRLMSPEEKAFAYDLVLLLKDILNSENLSDTYRGGMGGYTTTALVFAYLRNTQILVRNKPCQFTLSHHSVGICNDGEEKDDRTKNHQQTSFSSSRETYHNGVVVGYLGGKQYLVKHYSEKRIKVHSVAESQIHRITTPTYSDHNIEKLFEGLCRFISKEYLEYKYHDYDDDKEEMSSFSTVKLINLDVFKEIVLRFNNRRKTKKPEFKVFMFHRIQEVLKEKARVIESRKEPNNTHKHDRYRVEDIKY